MLTNSKIFPVMSVEFSFLMDEQMSEFVKQLV